MDVLMEYKRLWEDGQTHEAHSRNKEAILCYQQMMDLIEEDPVLYNNIATCYLHLDDAENCEKALRRGLDLDPENSQIIHNLTLILLNTDRMKEAEKLARRGINVPEIRGTSYLNLGEVLVEQGRIIRGLDALLEAEELIPDHPRVHLMLARAYFAAFDGKTADEHFMRAIELEPTNSIILTHYGACLNRCRSYAEAEDYLQRAVDNSPYNYMARIHLAESIMEQVKEDTVPGDRIKEAMNLLREVFSVCRTEGRAWLLWGIISIMFKQWEEVEKALETCLECDYDGSEVYMYLCVAKANLGDEEEAERMFKTMKRKSRLEQARRNQIEKQYERWKQKRGIA